MSVDPGPAALAGARRAVAERRWDEARVAFAAVDGVNSLARTISAGGRRRPTCWGARTTLWER